MANTLDVLKKLHQQANPGISTAYTVAAGADARNAAKQVLVTADEIRTILNQMLRVGQISSRQGDGSRPYAVFNKRDCAIKLAQVINDRFNAAKQAR